MEQRPRQIYARVSEPQQPVASNVLARQVVMTLLVIVSLLVVGLVLAALV